MHHHHIKLLFLSVTILLHFFNGISQCFATLLAHKHLWVDKLNSKLIWPTHALTHFCGILEPSLDDHLVFGPFLEGKVILDGRILLLVENLDVDEVLGNVKRGEDGLRGKRTTTQGTVVGGAEELWDFTRLVELKGDSS